jgi:hypothetical protein
MYTILTQGIGTFFTDQLPSFDFFQKMAYDAYMKITNNLPFSLTSQVNEKAQFLSSTKKILKYRYSIFYLVSWHVEHSRNQLCSRTNTFKTRTGSKKYFTLLPGDIPLGDAL